MHICVFLELDFVWIKDLVCPKDYFWQLKEESLVLSNSTSQANIFSQKNSDVLKSENKILI